MCIRSHQRDGNPYGSALLAAYKRTHVATDESSLGSTHFSTIQPAEFGALDAAICRALVTAVERAVGATFDAAVRRALQAADKRAVGTALGPTNA